MLIEVTLGDTFTDVTASFLGKVGAIFVAIYNEKRFELGAKVIKEH